MLSDLDDIGDFDLHTDVVLFTYRDAVYNRLTPNPMLLRQLLLGNATVACWERSS